MKISDKKREACENLTALFNGRIDFTKLAEEEEEESKKVTIYFLQCQETKNVKIGKTKHSVSKRISQFIGVCPTELRLLKTVVDETGCLEQELHNEFSVFRIKGKKEWYSPSKELLDYIEGLQEVPHE